MSKALAGQRGIVKAKPKTHFMTSAGEQGRERVSVCGQVRDSEPASGLRLVTVNCGNCIRLLKGKPPEFPGKMVMMIEATPKPPPISE